MCEIVKTSRDEQIDYIKVIALLLVFTVHFVGGFTTSWMTIPSSSSNRIVHLMFYHLANCCVPLFFMCSGYLLKNRELSFKQHYIKIVKVLLMYLFASIVCGIYRYIMGESIPSLIKGLFTFSTAHYGWYVKYYIVLFFLMPFLNIIYKKTNKKILLPLIIIITCIGAYGRYSNFVEERFALVILFKFLKNIFPILYYFLGIYIYDISLLLKEKGKIVSAKIQIVLSCCMLLLLGGYSVFEHYKYMNKPVYVIPNGYGTWITIVLSFLLFFILFYAFSNKKQSKIIVKISNATLIAYLVSFVFDDIIYRYTDSFVKPLPLYSILICVPIVAICSIVLGIIGNYIVKCVSDFGKRKQVDTNI